MPHTPHFLHETERRSGTHHRWRHFFSWSLWSVGLLFVFWVALLGFVSVQVGAALVDTGTSLERMQEEAMALQFDRAEAERQRAEAYLQKADRGFSILISAAWVPWVGERLRIFEDVVESSWRVLDGAEALLTIGSDLVRLSGLSEGQLRDVLSGVGPQMTFDDLPSETKRAMLERLSASADDLQALTVDIHLARLEFLQAKQDQQETPLVGLLAPLSERLADAEETLTLLSNAFSLLPEFAGLGEEKRTLLLFMNNNELRPGGGFIGTYGTLRMQDGEIKELRTKDVYSFDDAAALALTTTPPKALTAYNATSKWFFRDGNWSPDFAFSARSVLSLFRTEVAALPESERTGVQPAMSFHNVIGLTPTFASAILAITGPVTTGNQTFTSENVADKLEYQVEYGYVGQGLPPFQRKEILADLVNEVKRRLYLLPAFRWIELIHASEEALRAKQLVLYSENQEIQQSLERAAWAGRVVAKEGADTLFVVDANLASLKSDPAVERHIRYDVRRNTDGRLVAKTTIVYRHTGHFDWKTTRYRTYTRLYVPRGSQLIRAAGTLRNDKLKNPSGQPGVVDQGEELGLTTFGAFTSVEPGETRELVFEYLLPKEISDAEDAGSYQLQAWKQIGAAAHGLTLSIDFDKNVTSASPPEESQEWGDDRYFLNTKLDQDHAFVVTF